MRCRQWQSDQSRMALYLAECPDQVKIHPDDTVGRRKKIAQNIMLVMAKAMVKGKLNPGALTGLERFMLAQFTIPDRVPTMLAATNVEPSLIDKKYNYKLLASSVKANLELFAKVIERFPFDVIMVPCWLGLMLTGTAGLGVQFEIEEDRDSG